MRRLATLLACCAMAGESAHAWTAISSRQARVAGRSCVVLRLRGGLAKRRRTYLRYWLDEHGNRVYTALKVDPKGLPTLPAHPPNIRPYDDYFTEHRAKFLERHTRPTTGAAADGANRTSGGRMPADESFWDKAMKEWDASFETREWVRIAPPDGASRIQPQVIDWRDDGGVQSYRGQSRRFRSDEPGVIRPLNVSGRSASAPRAHVENEKDKSTHADSGAS